MRLTIFSLFLMLSCITTVRAESYLVKSGETLYLENKTIDAQGASCGIDVEPGGNFRGRNLKIVNAKSWLVRARGTVDLQSTVSLDDCQLSNTMHGAWIEGNVLFRSRGCEYTNWLHYGIALQGTARISPNYAFIGFNHFHDPKAGKGGARYPIFINNPEKVCNVLSPIITHNTIVGPGQDYDRTSETSTGTADQISVYYADGFAITDNLSSYGGENGITASLTSKNGVISRNRCIYNNGHGIQAGSKNTTPDPDVTGISITENHCLNNGEGFSPQQGKSIYGIYCQDAHYTTIRSNTVLETRKKRSQSGGINLAECDYISLGGNTVTCLDSAGYRYISLDMGTQTLHMDRLATLRGPLTVNSNASTVIQVDGDGCILSDTTINGQNHDRDRQIGIYSETSVGTRLHRINFSGVPTCIKLDLQAENWIMEDIIARKVCGIRAGFGYVVLIGSKGHIGRYITAYGEAGNGRHLLYLTNGAENCYFSNLFVNGFAHAGVTVNASHKPAKNNIIEHVLISNQAKGGTDAGGMEIDGNTSGIMASDISIINIKGHGFVVNTLGLTHDVSCILDGISISRCDQNGLFLKGTKNVRVTDLTVTDISKDNPGAWSCIDIESWPNQFAASQIQLNSVVLNAVGAREKITINPTNPKPFAITLDGAPIK